MQVLCDLQSLFSLFNCQTPEDVGEKLCNAVIEIASREDISYNRNGYE